MKRKLFFVLTALFLAACMVGSASAASPLLLTDGSDGGGLLFELAMILVIPVVIALIICMILKGQLKTAQKQTEASDYMVSAEPELTVKTDRFTHRTETRRKIEKK